VLDRGSVVARDTGGPQRVTGIIADITARKEAEAALAASQQRYEVAMLGSSDGLWDWDILNGQTYFAPSWKSMLGYEDDELVNEYATWERLVHPDDLAPTMAALQAYIAGITTPYAAEFRMLCRDGLQGFSPAARCCATTPASRSGWPGRTPTSPSASGRRKRSAHRSR
jgi:PAS domain S-box-containing protein